MRLAATALAVTAAASLHPVQQIAVPRATGVVVSPDGRNAYVRSGVGSLGSLRVFARAGASGRLTQLQCVAHRARACVDGRGLETPAAIALSPDGRSVYVAARNGQSVGIYARAARGTLRAAGSVVGLAHPGALAVSPDGRFVYVGGDRLWTFARASTGALTLVATLREPATVLALVGDTLYAGARGRLVAYARDAGTGGLTESTRAVVAAPVALAVARGSVYVLSGSALLRYDRSLQPAGRAGGLPLASALAVTDRVYVGYRDGVASYGLTLARGPRLQLESAVGVAAYGRFAYAVTRARISVLAP